MKVIPIEEVVDQCHQRFRRFETSRHTCISIYHRVHAFLILLARDSFGSDRSTSRRSRPNLEIMCMPELINIEITSTFS